MAFRGWPAEALEFYDGLEADNSRTYWTALIAWRQWPVAAWLGTAGARTRIVEFLRTSQALREWLDAHVGPTTVIDRQR